MKQSISISRVFITLASLVIILAGIKLSGEIIIPFLLSLFIAIICSPLIKMMRKYHIPLVVAIGLLFLLILLVFFFLLGLVNGAVHEFTASIPQYKVLLSQRINAILSLAQHFNLPISISQQELIEYLDPSIIMNFVSRLLLSFSGIAANIFVLLLVVVFMLLEADTLKHKFALILSDNIHDVSKEERYIDRILEGIISYLGVKTSVSILTGASVWILLEIIGVQYAILWATLTFLLNYIPNIGSVIAAVPIILQALLLNGFRDGLIVMVGVISINMLIGNIIEPRLMGRTLGLSTLVVFLSLLFWGWLLGTVGMLLSVPLTMALKIILEANPKTLRYANLLDNTGLLDKQKN